MKEATRDRNAQVKALFNELHVKQGYTVNRALEKISEMEIEKGNSITPDGIRNIVYEGGYYHKLISRPICKN